MSDRQSHRPSSFTADIQLPFRFSVIHGADPTKKSSQQKGLTKSVNLIGLVFETTKMEVDGYHLSFTESTYGRNSLEITLDLGKRFGNVELIGQVDWYERRPTPMGYTFVIGVTFIDIPADALSLLRDFLQQNRSLRT
jgi:hypothetical protein